MTARGLTSSVRVAIGLAWGLAVTVLAYVAVRLVDVVLFPEPNPIVVIWTDRSRFLWRVLIAIYLGGAAVFSGTAMAARSPEHVPIWLERMILWAGACLILQTIFAP